MIPQKRSYMLVVERHARIAQAIQDGRVVSTPDLVELLGVSAETIRRDLAGLEAQGALIRVRGGAMHTGHLGDEAPFAERSATASAAKDLIGELAAGLVRPGQTVVLDVGTTAVRVARALAGSFSGTVFTCSVLVAEELADASDIETHVSSGRMRRGDLALSGTTTQAFFSDVFADVAFLGSGGVHREAGLTDFYLDECHVRRTIIRNSATSYALVDSKKHQRIAPYRVAPLDQLTGVITDEEAPSELDEALASADVQIVYPTSDPAADPASRDRDTSRGWSAR